MKLNKKRLKRRQMPAMGGVDAVVFTAGIGENSSTISRKYLEGMDWMGISVDSEKNMSGGKEADISQDKAEVRTLIIATNEELMIGRETARLLA